MIPIYICDDNLHMLHRLKEMIHNKVLINGYDMQIEQATAQPECLLKHRSEKDVRSIYFLDVDLKHEQYTGFTLAKAIRKLDPRGFIIFVTTHGELMPETFKHRIEALGYIVKDDIAQVEEQIDSCIKEIQELIQVKEDDNQSYYSVKVADVSYQLPLKDILYVEVSGPHQLTLCSTNRRIEFRGELTKVSKELPDYFLKVHQSFLVNRNAIREVDKKRSILRLNEATEIPISRRGKKLLL